MKTRLISAAILLPVLFLVIWILPKVVCTFVIALLAAGAAYELLYRTGLVRHVRLVAYSALAAFMVPVWCHWGMSHAWGLLGLLAFVCALFAEMLVNHVKVRFDKIAICFVAGILLPYLLSSIVRILDTYTGREVIIIPMILAFLPDSGAYFIGIRFGKRKLSPVVSPNKTVEGAIGGTITAIVGMLVYAQKSKR